MILAVMPFGVMAFFFYNAGNYIQLIAYEITPLGWVLYYFRIRLYDI